MSNSVRVKRSSVPGKVPTLAVLSAGELGINTADKKLFFSTGTEVAEVAKMSDLAATIGATAENVSMPGGSTLLQDSNIRGSSGVADGTVQYVVQGTGTAITVLGGSGYLRSTNDQQGDLNFITWPTATDLYTFTTPDAGQELTTFVGVEYNGGSPRAVAKSALTDFNWYDNFPLARVAYDGIEVSILNAYAHAEDTANLTRQWMRLTHPFIREEPPEGTGGLEVTSLGRSLTMTAGKMWHGFNRYTISAILVGSSFNIGYKQSGGGFLVERDATLWPNTKYDNGSGTLQDLTDSYYGTLSVYLNLAVNKLELIYGTVNASSVALAQLGTLPAIPDHLRYHGVLVGRLIFLKGAVSATLVESAWQSKFSGSTVGDHSLMANMNTETYTHLTGTQAQDLTDGGNTTLHTHDLYLTEAEADAAYADIAHIHATGNLLTVSKTPSLNEFATLASALAVIGTGSYAAASSTNRYVIKVGPGEFTEAAGLTIPAYVYVCGNDPWNSAVLKTNDLTNDFITISPNGGMFNLAVSGPTTAGKSAVKQVASGTTKLYWVNIKEGSYGITLAPASGAARCHCIGVVTDGPTVMNRMFNIDNPVGVGVFILMQSGPMSTTWVGAQPSAVYLNGNGTASKVNATLDLCQFRGSGYDAIYGDNAAVVRGISCSFAGGVTAIHVGPNGLSKVDVHGSQIKPGGWTKDIWIESTTAQVSYSGVATDSKITVATGAVFTGNFADTALGGQVIDGELWIGNTTVKTPIAAYVQADKNTGIVAGGNVSHGAGSFDVTLAAGSGFLDTISGLKVVNWGTTALVLPDSKATLWIYVGADSIPTVTDIEPDGKSVVLVGIAVTNAIKTTFLTDMRTVLPHHRACLHEYLRDVMGPMHVSGGMVSMNSINTLGVDIDACTFYLQDNRQVTQAIEDGTWNAWYRDGAGGWTFITGANQVNNTKYDDGSGVLADIPAGKYKRSILFLSVSGSGEELHGVYGQELFDSADLAIRNPIPPDILLDNAILLSAVVIQSGATSIHSLVDQRPKLGQMAAGSTAVTKHNQLSRLSIGDDHPQYQLKSAKGQASGYCDLDSNQLVPIARLPAMVHGDQAGGSLHANATTSVPGFLSSTDKTKLDGIATGATANSSDVVLKDRASHTGVQAIATVTNLQTELNGKEASGAAAAAVAAHAALIDPHSQYLTSAEGDTAYSLSGHSHLDAVANGSTGFMTGADKAKLDAVTGSNTGDETLATLKSKLGISTLSGSNTGDQTITLTGDVSGSGTGSFSTTLSVSGVVAGTYNSSATAQTPYSVDDKGRLISVGAAVTITPLLESIQQSGATIDQFSVWNGSAWTPTTVLVGIVKQLFYGTLPSMSGTSLIPAGTVAPLITGGTQLWAQTITPTSLTSKIKIDLSMWNDSSSNTRSITIALFRGNVCIQATNNYIKTAGQPQCTGIVRVDVPNTLSAVTYSLRIGISSAATWYMNTTAVITYGGNGVTNTAVTLMDIV